MNLDKSNGLVVDNPNVIMTRSGILFDFVDPKPDQVRLSDISFALSGILRWGSHHGSGISVASHSVDVAKRLEDAGHPYWVCMQGLMHDATEAYIGDMCRPIKRKFPEFSVMEDRIMEAIAQALCIRWPLEDAVHEMDSAAMHEEWKNFNVRGAESREVQAARFESEYWRLRALCAERAADYATEAYFRSIG